MGDCEMTGLENVKEALVDVRDCGHLERFPVLGNKIIKAIEAIDADRHAPDCKTFRCYIASSDCAECCLRSDCFPNEQLIQQYAETYASERCAECRGIVK